MNPLELLAESPRIARILVMALLAVLAHLLVRGIHRLSETLAAPAGRPGTSSTESFARRYPKVATVTSLVVSALTFVIYFVAIGLILGEIGVPVAVYLGSASVVGLAIGFGSQGLVQDVVIGLTLLFSDAFSIGDMIEVSGQVGRVDRIGLRFTTLVNFHGQRVYVPNRNIMLVSRFRGGCIRAYVDIQIPEGADEAAIASRVEEIARGMRAQHRSMVVTDPEIFGVFEAEPAGWRYLRVKFRLWPGQGAIIETTFRQRVLAVMKEVDPGFADWMVAVTYRVV